MKLGYMKYLALISQLGLMMVIPIFLCLFIGIWLDKKIGTNGLFVIIFLIIGVLAAFRNLFVIVLSKVDSGKKEHHDERK